MSISERLQSEIASKIRSTYIFLRCRNQQIPDMRLGEKWDRFWLAAAELCQLNQIDPVEFVEVQFYCCKPWPYINWLASEAAVLRFWAYRKKCAARAAQRVLVQLGSLENFLRAGGNLETALKDPNYDFDSLFIYITAKTNGFDELAKKHFLSALAQYVTSSYYDAIYKDAIPEELKQGVLDAD